MMHFSSFFWLPFILFVLHFCRPTLAASSGEGAMLADHIICPALLPDNLPPIFWPPLRSLFELCANTGGHPNNMQCVCIGELLICGASHHGILWPLINYCFRHCVCGPKTEVVRYSSTQEINYRPTSNLPARKSSKKPLSPVKNPTGRTHTCSSTCTSVDHGCASRSTEDCTCFAPPVGLFYWHQRDCGTRLPFKAKRDLAQQRHSYYRNATARFASSNKAAAPPGLLPDLGAQLGSGLLPSPCNASYVSFACSDSADGIVHEPPQNWLGALLPKDASQFPPVPERFLRIHGKEGKLQVIVEGGVK